LHKAIIIRADKCFSENGITTNFLTSLSLCIECLKSQFLDILQSTRLLASVSLLQQLPQLQSSKYFSQYLSYFIKVSVAEKEEGQQLCLCLKVYEVFFEARPLESWISMK